MGRRHHETERWDESTERNQIYNFCFEPVAGLRGLAGSICILGSVDVMNIYGRALYGVFGVHLDAVL